MSQRKWQKSSFSEGGADTCAEVGDEDGISRIRESDEPGRVSPPAGRRSAPCWPG
ncbi:DUF397 domain-containing protein [Streptomyces lycii]|uniref:DUF397 domain-containing protein n=1 Tax=Streptomyces lycii TaxID=2654337 RepID=UPI001F479413|nr:DUF397 domain-containing protein [Streptomyces lycii]